MNYRFCLDILLVYCITCVWSSRVKAYPSFHLELEIECLTARLKKAGAKVKSFLSIAAVEKFKLSTFVSEQGPNDVNSDMLIS